MDMSSSSLDMSINIERMRVTCPGDPIATEYVEDNLTSNRGMRTHVSWMCVTDAVENTHAPS